MPTLPLGNKQQKFLGMLTKKERWGFSWRGWLALGIGILVFGGIVVLNIQPFLAVTDRVDSNYLVMEGWVHQFTARATAEEFKAGNYRQIFITGTPVEGNGEYDSDSNTDAWVGAGLLRRVGVPEEFLQRVPHRKVARDRTYSSALELKKWFQEHNYVVQGINVVTEDAHARRTRLLFQEAFGPDVKIGIIAVPDPDYDQKRWWHNSEGVREVLSETIAYTYVKLFFWPSKSPS